MENYYCAKHFICFYCALNKHLNEILSPVIVFWCQQQVGYCVRLCVLLKKKRLKDRLYKMQHFIYKPV